MTNKSQQAQNNAAKTNTSNIAKVSNSSIYLGRNGKPAYKINPNAETYHEHIMTDVMDKLNIILKELPECMSDYFRSIQFSTEPRTRLGYATDLQGFCTYLIQSCTQISVDTVNKLTIQDFEAVTAADIEEYLGSMQLYRKNGRKYSNGEQAIKRKLSSIRGFYKYLHINQIINVNPSLQVKMPKLHNKSIIKFNTDEVGQFLDNVESGTMMTNHQLAYHNKLKARDLAITTLLVGTGIRVSECVGLDITDVDFKEDCIKVIRKGGSEDIVYFGAEVRAALLEYMSERRLINPVEEDTNALFISSRNRRITVRSVEILVKKYAQTVTTLKKITPHKLRSTYGTNLYNETGDIYLVASVLGHKSVNTTQKHYVDSSDTKKLAKNMVKLRNNKDTNDTQQTD